MNRGWTFWEQEPNLVRYGADRSAVVTAIMTVGGRSWGHGLAVSGQFNGVGSAGGWGRAVRGRYPVRRPGVVLRPGERGKRTPQTKGSSPSGGGSLVLASQSIKTMVLGSMVQPRRLRWDHRGASAGGLDALLALLGRAIAVGRARIS